MKNYIIIFFGLVISTVRCNSQDNKALKEVIVELADTAKHPCVKYFVDGKPQKIYREIEIIENNLTDTTNIGFACIPPGKKGSFIFLQDSEDGSTMVSFHKEQPVSIDDPKSYAYVFCAFPYLYRKEAISGSIKLKIRVLKE